MANLTDSIFTIAKANVNTLENVPVQNGQLIFVEDAQQIYFDYNGIRQYYCQPIKLTDQERKTIISPKENYYYTTDTNIMWYYKFETGWQQLTPSNLTPIVFDELPQEGKNDTLYVDGKSIKRWKNGKYEVVADVFQWGILASA